MRAWPDLTEYHEAVQHPPKAFADPGLKAVTLELDRFGMPKPATGGNAVVYKANEPGGLLTFKKTWAIRCFLRPISDHAERYEAISKHLRKVRLPYDVNFQYLKQGIQIRSNWFPIVKMQWAKGDLLHSHIEKHLGYPAALAALRAKWTILVRHLEAAQVAHGDLQHGNILVRGGSIQLVDYDGMWVPALSGRHATEIGHRAYQQDRKSTRLNSSHDQISYAVFCLKKKKTSQLWGWDCCARRRRDCRPRAAQHAEGVVSGRWLVQPRGAGERQTDQRRGLVPSRIVE